MKRQRLEWVVAGVAILMFASIVATQLLSARSRAINQLCDNIYVALSGAWSGESSGAPVSVAPAKSAYEAVEMAVRRHKTERNPRNRGQRAFTSSPVEPEDSCQVRIEAFASDGVLFSQYPRRDAQVRTFAIRVAP